jgi:hypothetical protein
MMRLPDQGVETAAAHLGGGRKCAACAREEMLQKRSGPQAAFGEAPASVHEVLRSPGQPLDAATRAYFEPRIGWNFSAVRVHTGTLAAQSARDVNAHAYAVGQDLVFDAGRFAPGTHEGKRLIAHELAHVVQQSGSDTIHANLGNQEGGTLPFQIQQPRTAGPFVVSRAPGDGGPSSPATPLPSTSENVARLAELMDQWVPSPEKQWSTTISRAAAIELKTGRRVYLIAIAGEGANVPIDPSLLLPDEVLVPYAGGHAEIQTMRFADAKGYKILPGALEPSRAFCVNCAWWARKEGLAPPGARVRVGQHERPLAEVSNKELIQNLGENRPPRWRGELTAKGEEKRAKSKLPRVPTQRPATLPGGVAEPALEVGPEMFGPEAEGVLGSVAAAEEGALAGEVIGPRAAGLIGLLTIVGQIYLYGELSETREKLQKMHERYEKKHRQEIQQRLLKAADLYLKDRAGRILQACWIDKLKALEKEGKQIYVRLTMKVEFENTGSDSVPRSISDVLLHSTELRHIEVTDRAEASSATELTDTGDKAFLSRNKIFEQTISFSVPAPTAAALEKEFGNQADQETCVEAKSCFIATACYGSSEGEHLDVLRAFRDQVLVNSSMGRSFVRMYYRHSPPVANWLASHPIARAVVRDCMITPLVKILRPLFRQSS